MPVYRFQCPKCGNIDENFQHGFKKKRYKCSNCNEIMKKILALTGDIEIDYAKPVLSDAMGVHPDQVAEHRRRWPDVPITDDGRVVCRSHMERRRIMKKLQFHDKDGYF